MTCQGRPGIGNGHARQHETPQRGKFALDKVQSRLLAPGKQQRNDGDKTDEALEHGGSPNQTRLQARLVRYQIGRVGASVALPAERGDERCPRARFRDPARFVNVSRQKETG